MNQRHGLSLIEVIVGLALMGSIFVTSLLAFSKHRRQLRVAEQQIEAAMIADGLIEQLSAQPDGIPLTGRGAIAGKLNWVWQTTPVGNSIIADIPVQVIRFEIYQWDETPTRLVSVEVVR